MKLVKTIRSKSGELHFKRWQLLKTPWFCIYIHGIYHEDEDDHLHNHPWNIWTMILWGSYVEELLTKNRKDRIHKIRTFLNMGYRNSERFHCIKSVLSKKVYTLAIVSNRKHELWGYHTEKGFVDHITYRENKSKRK
jgi:hypothetical protein